MQIAEKYYIFFAIITIYGKVITDDIKPILNFFTSDSTKEMNDTLVMKKSQNLEQFQVLMILLR